MHRHPVCAPKFPPKFSSYGSSYKFSKFRTPYVEPNPGTKHVQAFNQPKRGAFIETNRASFAQAHRFAHPSSFDSSLERTDAKADGSPLNEANRRALTLAHDCTNTAPDLSVSSAFHART